MIYSYAKRLSIKYARLEFVVAESLARGVLGDGSFVFVWVR